MFSQKIALRTPFFDQKVFHVKHSEEFFGFWHVSRETFGAKMKNGCFLPDFELKRAKNGRF